MCFGCTATSGTRNLSNDLQGSILLSAYTTNLGGVVCRSVAGSVQCKMCSATPLPLLLPECQ